jgi:tetratricopeptide (TPR) repeat protein
MSFMLSPPRAAGLVALVGALVLLVGPARAQQPPAEGADPAQPVSTPAAPEPDPAAVALESGWEQIRVSNFDAAAELLPQAAGSSDPELAAEAHYALGHLWQFRVRNDDLDRAKREYQTVVDSYPKTRAAPWAMLALARLADLPTNEDDREIDSARTQYQRIIQTYPDHMAADEAAYRFGHTYLEQIGQPEAQNKGIEFLLNYIRTNPDSFLAPAMLLDIGRVYVSRQQWDQAVEYFVRADATDQAFAETYGTRTLSFNRLSAMYFQIAQIAEFELKDIPLAIRWYRRIINELDRDNKIYWARKSLERLGAADPADADSGDGGGQ